MLHSIQKSVPYRSAAQVAESLWTDKELHSSQNIKGGGHGRDHDLISDHIHFTVRALVGKGFAPVAKSLKDAYPGIEPRGNVVWNFPVHDNRQSRLRIPDDNVDED